MLTFVLVCVLGFTMRKSRTGRRWNVNLRALDPKTKVVEKSFSHPGEVRLPLSRPLSLPFRTDEPNFFFSGLGYHTSTCADDKLIVLGGSDGSQSFSSIDVLDLKTNVWHRLDRTLDNSPVSRAFHSTVLVGDSLFAVGGHDGKSYAKDILAFDFRPFSVSFLLLCAGRSG